MTRFGYGRIVPALRRLNDTYVATAGPDAIGLHTPAPTVADNTATMSTFEVAAGEAVPFTLTWFPSHAPCPAVDPNGALRRTDAFWRDWSSQSS